MLRDILAFEWRYYTRQISFTAAVLLFFFFGFMVTATGFGPDNVNINSPYSIAQSLGLLSLLSVFVLAAFCSNAVIRDRELQMEEIVFSTAVEKLPFLLGRFGGAFLAGFTAFSVSVAGMLLARFMPWQEASRLGPTQVGHYLWALAIVALPNVLFAAVVLFGVSTITRSVLASYIASVLVYILYFVASALTNSPLMAASVPGANESVWLASLLDPFALSAFFAQTQHWTPGERNTQLVSLSGQFLLNRVTWIAVFLAAFGLVYRNFSFRIAARSSKAVSMPVARAVAGRTSRYRPVLTEPRNGWKSWLAATALELRAYVLTLPFLAVAVLWAGLAAFELVAEVTRGEYGSAGWPASGILLATIRTPLALLATILIVYLSAEMVWRERTLRIAGILNATPAPNVAFLAAKCTALTAIVGLLTLIGYGAGALLQVARGWTVEPAVLLAFAYFSAAPLVVFALLAVVIQTLSPHKYFGMLLVLLVAVIGQQGANFGLEHPLWRFGSTVPIAYSDLSGFSPAAGFHWLIGFWGTLAVLLLVAAGTMWRSSAEALPRRLSLLKRSPIPARIAAIVLLVAFVGSGGVIVYNTNFLNDYQTRAAFFAWKADYEREYGVFAMLPQPRIRDVRARIALEPSQGRYRVRGEYTLVNETGSPVDTILLSVRREARVATMTVAAPNERMVDARFGQHLFRLDPPLASGAQTTVRFELEYGARGFATDSPDPAIVGNGSYIMSFRSLPVVGYRSTYEIEDSRERKRQSLAARSAAAEAGRVRPDGSARAEWVRSDLVISTERDQIALAPGQLVSTSDDGTRRSFHYRSSTPIPNQLAIASARYRVVRKLQDGVSIEIYHHPGHEVNVARIMRATAESLRLFSSRFGPYPHSHLRIVEVPAHWNFGGFAQPGVIFLNENRGFLIDVRDPQRLDLLYRRVAHEVAHQWWGHQVSAADVPGATTLTESLTKYSELLALEKAHGLGEVRRSLTYELDAYLKDRTGESGVEPPLTRSEQQSYVFYRKGAIVLNALRELLGEQAMTAALRRLVREQGGPDRSPTTAHLMEALHAVATSGQRALIDDWMNDVVLYDLTLDSASARALPNGRFAVTLRVRAARERQRAARVEPLRMREPITIGLFADDPDATQATLYAGKHILHGGAQAITIVVDQVPEVAALDPWITRIDRNRFDNTVSVTKE